MGGRKCNYTVNHYPAAYRNSPVPQIPPPSVSLRERITTSSVIGAGIEMPPENFLSITRFPLSAALHSLVVAVEENNHEANDDQGQTPCGCKRPHSAPLRPHLRIGEALLDRELVMVEARLQHPLPIVGVSRRMFSTATDLLERAVGFGIDKWSRITITQSSTIYFLFRTHKLQQHASKL